MNDKVNASALLIEPFPIEFVTKEMATAAYRNPKVYQARMFYQILSNSKGKIKFNDLSQEWAKRTAELKNLLNTADWKKFQRSTG